MLGLPLPALENPEKAEKAQRDCPLQTQLNYLHNMNVGKALMFSFDLRLISTPFSQKKSLLISFYLLLIPKSRSSHLLSLSNIQQSYSTYTRSLHRILLLGNDPENRSSLERIVSIPWLGFLILSCIHLFSS